MSEWQLIETAPKDGSIILVCGGGIISVAAYAEGGGPGVSSNRTAPYDFYAAANGSALLDEGWDDGAGWKMKLDPYPTHWMPLPAPPVT